MHPLTKPKIIFITIFLKNVYTRLLTKENKKITVSFSFSICDKLVLINVLLTFKAFENFVHIYIFNRA